MLAIRFIRTGRKNQPNFKIVVTQKTRSSTSRKFIEEVGFYNPLTKERVLKGERIKYWISTGAKPSPTVHNLLIKEHIIEGAKIPVHQKAEAKPEAQETPQGAQATSSQEASEPQAQTPAENTPAAPPAQEEVQQEAPAENAEPEKEE